MKTSRKGIDIKKGKERGVQKKTKIWKEKRSLVQRGL